MKHYTTASLVACLAVSTNAACRLENHAGPGQYGTEFRPELCTNQTGGSGQIALDVSEVGVPTFGDDNAFAGVTGDHAFIVYDAACSVTGVYSPSGNDCGILFEIEFLKFGHGCRYYHYH